jgi:hypothetical protein
MQFLVYGIDQNPQASGVPSSEQIIAMRKFMQEAIAAKIVVATGGLTPTGTRIRFSGEIFTVTDGPFIEAKELIAGFAIIEVPSKEEAVA